MALSARTPIRGRLEHDNFVAANDSHHSRIPVPRGKKCERALMHRICVWPEASSPPD
jgi:hypothetical protein